MAGRETTEILLWQEYTMSVEKASRYFCAGQAKLCRIINENEDTAIILWNGNRLQIKRKQFENLVTDYNLGMTQ